MRKKIAEISVIAVSAAGMILCLLALGLLLAEQAVRPMENDAHIYFAMGRGIISGFVPYKDLFETKPPGIFLLAALSLAVTGGRLLAHVLYLLALGSIPVLLAVLILRKSRGIPLAWRLAWIAAAFLIGTVLTLYIVERNGVFQPEAIGTVFGLLFLLDMISARTARMWIHDLLAPLFLLLAIGIKEPFLFTLAAAALLLTPHPRAFFRFFIVPLFIGGLISVMLLQLLGILRPYIGLYLPFMMYYTSGPPLWQRGFDATLLLRDARSFSLFLPFLLIGMAATIPLFGTRRDRLAASGIALILWTLLLSCGFWIVGMILKDASTFAVPIAAYIFVMLISGVLLIIARRRALDSEDFRPLAYWAIMIGIGFYAATISIATSGTFYPHHFVFPAPIFLALTIIFLLRGLERHDRRLTRILCIVFVVGGAFAVTNLGLRHAAQAEQTAMQFDDDLRRTAANVDALLDRCGIEQYLPVGDHGTDFYGYTTHSPLGPWFSRDWHNLNPEATFFHQAFLQNVREAPIVIVYEPFLAPFLQTPQGEDLVSTHTTNVPRCGRGLLPMEGYAIFFRS